MQIKDKVLYINKTDFDHILWVFDFINETLDEKTKLKTPLSEIFRVGLETELEFNGLYKIPYAQIVLNLEWEENKWLNSMSIIYKSNTVLGIIAGIVCFSIAWAIIRWECIRWR